MGLRCLPKSLFADIQNEKGWRIILHICNKYKNLMNFPNYVFYIGMSDEEIERLEKEEIEEEEEAEKNKHRDLLQDLDNRFQEVP